MIFINYRKVDSQAVVDNLANELKRRFGVGRVFKDDQDIGGGEQWPERLRQAVMGCDVLLAVIGEQWLTVHDEHGRRRIDDDEDWVRREIVTALGNGKWVLPVLVGSARMPSKQGLTGNLLQPITELQGLPLRPGRDFDGDVAALVRTLSARIPTAPFPAAGPAAAGSAPRPLPPKPPVCFGRDQELARLLDLLAPTDPAAKAPATPVAGNGGIGKSTLVLTALHHERVVARYGDHRHFVRLDGADSRAGVVAATADAAGLTLGDQLESRLMQFLQSGGPRLLVLDNAETPLLAGPEARLETEELLQQLAQIPSLTVAVTLRPGYTLGAGWGPPFEVRRIAAAAARDTFLANTGGRFADDPALDALLHDLDGWPLAVTLLAYQARFVAELEELANAWRTKRTALLSKGVKRRDADLGASMELSLGSRHMTEGARRLLTLLGLLPDGVRRADLAELLPPDGPGAASSLRQVGGVAFDEGPRLRVLAPVRDYLAASHPPSDEDRERAVRFYCGVAEADGSKAGKLGGAEAIARVAAESGNLMAMVRLGLKAPDPEPAVKAALGLGRFSRFSGIDLSAVLVETLQCAQYRNNDRREADCHRCLGDVAFWRSDRGEARRRYELALPLYRRVGHVAGEADCVQGLGECALDRSDHAEARRRFDVALPMYRRAAYLSGEANCTFRLGDIALDRSNYGEARRLYEQALSLFRRAGSVLGEAHCVAFLGETALRDSDYDEARRRFEEALPLYRSVGSIIGEANCIAAFGDLALVRGDHARAKDRFDAAIQLYQQVGDPEGEGESWRSMGDMAKAQGDLAAARRCYEKSLTLFVRNEDPYYVGEVHQRLARVTEANDRRRHVQAARDSWVGIDRPDLVAELDREFGAVGPDDPPGA